MAKKEKQSLSPLGIHLLIEPLPPENEYIIAGKSKEKPEKGILKAVGEKVESEVLRKSIGETVVYRKYSPEEFKVNGKTLFLIEEADVMGIWQG